MRRLTDAQTAVVKQYNLTPENIGEKRDTLDCAEISTWCRQNGYTEGDSPMAVKLMLERIDDKFWDSDGFDAVVIEDVATWVLTTYLTLPQLQAMSDEQIIEYLQNWKYFFGFRKHEGNGWRYRLAAYDAFMGLVQQDLEDEEIYYRAVQDV